MALAQHAGLILAEDPLEADGQRKALLHAGAVRVTLRPWRVVGIPPRRQLPIYTIVR